MITQEQIYAKAKELNMEVIEIFREGTLKVKLKCKTHPNKPERVADVKNFVEKQKSCGCRLKFYDEEDFKQDLADKQIPYKLVGKYVNDGEKAQFECEKGHIFEATPNKIKQGRGCPYCKGDKLKAHFIKTTEQFKKDLEKANPSIELIGEYNGAFEPITYRCEVCDRTSTSVADKVLRKDASCHFCTSSLGERIVYVCLEERKINFEIEKTFEDCFYKNKLRFDFYLPDYNMCIEFQGEQHFRPVDFSYTPTEESKLEAKEKFQLNQIRDEIKRKYCKDKGIKLLEINYKDIDNIKEILENNI